ncbi:unnamed protein product [Phytomonas sp. Hart1]|nr:unnamed protein product [Phytomonas sp. Hart1]|eukprot:CCW67616.1 unnamed protein product [Phytomonas sp. isolate Hart1]
MSVHKNGLDFPSKHYPQNGISDEIVSNNGMTKSETEKSSFQRNDNTHHANFVTSPSAPFQMKDASTKVNFDDPTYQSGAFFPHFRYRSIREKESEMNIKVLKHSSDETLHSNPNWSPNCASGEESRDALFVSVKVCRDRFPFSKRFHCEEKNINRRGIREGSLGLSASKFYTSSQDRAQTGVDGKTGQATPTPRSALHTPEASAGNSPSLFTSKRQPLPREDSKPSPESIPEETLHGKHPVCEGFASGQVLLESQKDLQHARDGDQSEIDPTVPYTTSLVQETLHNRRKHSDCRFRRQGFELSQEKVITSGTFSSCIPQVAICLHSSSTKEFMDPAPSQFLAREPQYFEDISIIHGDPQLADNDDSLIRDRASGTRTSIQKKSSSRSHARLYNNADELNVSRIPHNSGFMDESIQSAHDSSSLSLLADCLCRKARWLEEENQALRRWLHHGLHDYGETATSFPTKPDHLRRTNSSQSPFSIQSTSHLESPKAMPHKRNHFVDITPNPTSKNQHGNCEDGVAFCQSSARQEERTTACKATASSASKMPHSAQEERESTRFMRKSSPFQTSSTRRMPSTSTNVHPQRGIPEGKRNAALDFPIFSASHSSGYMSWEETKKSVPTSDIFHTARDPYKRQTSPSEVIWRPDLERQGSFIRGAGAPKGRDDGGIKYNGFTKDKAGLDDKDYTTPIRPHSLPSSARNGPQAHNKDAPEDLFRFDAYRNYLEATHRYLWGLHHEILSTSKKLQHIHISTPRRRHESSSSKNTDFTRGINYQGFHESSASAPKPEVSGNRAEGVSKPVFNHTMQNTPISPQASFHDFPSFTARSPKSRTGGMGSRDGHSVCEEEVSPSVVPNIQNCGFSGLAMATSIASRRKNLAPRSSTPPEWGLGRKAHEGKWRPHTDVFREFHASPGQGPTTTPMVWHVDSNEPGTFGNKRGSAFQKDFAHSSGREDKHVGATMSSGEYHSFSEGSRPVNSRRLGTTVPGPTIYSPQSLWTELTSEHTRGIRNASENDYRNTIIPLVGRNKGESNPRGQFHVSPRVCSRKPYSFKSCIDSDSDPYPFSISIETARRSAGKGNENKKCRFSLPTNLLN